MAKQNLDAQIKRLMTQLKNAKATLNKTSILIEDLEAEILLSAKTVEEAIAARKKR